MLELTQLLVAGLGSTVGVNPNVVTQLKQRSSMHTTIKEMLSAQHKQSLLGRQNFLPVSVCVFGWI